MQIIANVLILRGFHVNQILPIYQSQLDFNNNIILEFPEATYIYSPNDYTFNLSYSMYDMVNLGDKVLLTTYDEWNQLEGIVSEIHNECFYVSCKEFPQYTYKIKDDNFKAVTKIE